ncbi:MAG: hypothetical protein J6N78_06110 [Clostridia bacterium]|nr:hypothetical protein [Clostridia bacterium]
MSTEEKLLKLRNKLEFIKNSNIPSGERDKRNHRRLVYEAERYLCELDEVEIYVEKCIITEKGQIDCLINKHKHAYLHNGRFIQIIEVIVATKHHFFAVLEPVSAL